MFSNQRDSKDSSTFLHHLLRYQQVPAYAYETSELCRPSTRAVASGATSGDAFLGGEGVGGCGGAFSGGNVAAPTAAEPGLATAVGTMEVRTRASPSPPPSAQPNNKGRHNQDLRAPGDGSSDGQTGQCEGIGSGALKKSRSEGNLF